MDEQPQHIVIISRHEDCRTARFYLIGLFATIGHLLDGHHLIGANVMSLKQRSMKQEVGNNFYFIAEGFLSK